VPERHQRVGEVCDDALRSAIEARRNGFLQGGDLGDAHGDSGSGRALIAYGETISRQGRKPTVGGSMNAVNRGRSEWAPAAASARYEGA
jgi:hypothetical protein